ncbi:MAG: mycofactocin biosynthesis chaperone MftB [Acidimicrobiales bacterium]
MSSSSPARPAAAAAIDPSIFDASRPWQLHHRVALRPEPFGAMAYHYDNRRLNFLRSPELVALVESLDRHPSARAGFEALGIDERRWPSFERALASLALWTSSSSADDDTAPYAAAPLD